MKTARTRDVEEAWSKYEPLSDQNNPGEGWVRGLNPTRL